MSIFESLSRGLLVGLLWFAGASFVTAASAQDGILDPALAAQEAGNKGEALRIFRSLCEEGNATACFYTGRFYRDGTVVQQNYETAVDYFIRACDDDDAKGCASLAWMHYNGWGVEKNWARTAALAEPHCYEGTAEPAACNYVGLVYDNGGNGVAKDPRRAFNFFMLACDGGRAMGCSNVGYAYRVGSGVKKDIRKSVAYYRKGCDLEAAAACYSLALRYLRGEGVAEDHRAAITAFRSACNLESAGGCFQLGHNLKQSIDEKAMDGPQGREVIASYKKACSLGEGAACANLGGLYARGTGVQASPENSFALYEQACDLGSAFGCDKLGFAHRDGSGTPVNEDEALKAFIRACELDRAEACRSVGNWAGKGRGMAIDRQAALAWYRRGCDTDEPDAQACNNVGYYLLGNYGTAQNVPEARGYFEKSCAMNLPAACIPLVEMLHRGQGGAVDKDRARTLAANLCSTGFSNYLCDPNREPMWLKTAADESSSGRDTLAVSPRTQELQSKINRRSDKFIDIGSGKWRFFNGAVPDGWGGTNSRRKGYDYVIAIKEGSIDRRGDMISAWGVFFQQGATENRWSASLFHDVYQCAGELRETTIRISLKARYDTTPEIWRVERPNGPNEIDDDAPVRKNLRALCENDWTGWQTHDGEMLALIEAKYR